MEFNLADLFENAVDTFGSASTWSPTASAAPTRDGGAREPARAPPRRARRRPGDHVGIYALQLASSGSRRSGRSSSCARSGSTSTTATSRTSCATCSTTPTSSALDLPARVRAARRGRARRAAEARALDRDRGRQRRRFRRARLDRVRAGAGVGLARARLRAALRRRPLHPLHRRHDRHAEGRRLATRGRVLRARRRHRPDDRRARRAARGHGRARQGRRGHLPADRAADARRDAVGGDGPQLRRPQERAGREVRPERGLATGRSARR